MSNKRIGCTAETILFFLGIIIWVWISFLAYWLIVSIISLFPALYNTVKTGNAKSVGTYFLTVALAIGLCASIVFLFAVYGGLPINIAIPIITTLLIAIALFWGLYKAKWKTLNRPFAKIWAWNRVKLWPEGYSHVAYKWHCFSKKSCELKEMTFDQLLKTL